MEVKIPINWKNPQLICVTLLFRNNDCQLESWTRKVSPFSSTFYRRRREGPTPSKLTSNRDGRGERQREKVERSRSCNRGKEGKGWEMRKVASTPWWHLLAWKKLGGKTVKPEGWEEREILLGRDGWIHLNGHVGRGNKKVKRWRQEQLLLSLIQTCKVGAGLELG